MSPHCVLGVHVGLEAPSAGGRPMLGACVSSKGSAGELVEQRGAVDHVRLAEGILVDNGPEFHGGALERGCSEYGITL